MSLLFTDGFENPEAIRQSLVDDGSVYGNGVNPEPIICGLCRKQTGMAVTQEVDGYVMLVCPECDRRDG